ncbi:hypothetical protein BJX96DRAFT_8334 [Aspergillus floccosus]
MFCNASHGTSFSVLLACFRAAHYRMTGVPDANIGAMFPSHENQETRPAAALPVCLRIQVDDEDSFEQLIQHVQTTLDSATHHQGLSSGAIVECLGRFSDNPLYLMTFAMHRETARRQQDETMKSPLTTSELDFHLYEDDSSIFGEVRYTSDSFTPSTISTILSVFAVFWSAVCKILEDVSTRCPWYMDMQHFKRWGL